VVQPTRSNRESPLQDASATPPSVEQSDDLEAFSNTMLGYINCMLMAEDINDKFEHYLEHPAVVAALLTTSSLSHLLQEYV
jgi:hypothetical protein